MTENKGPRSTRGMHNLHVDNHASASLIDVAMITLRKFKLSMRRGLDKLHSRAPPKRKRHAG